MKYQNLANSDLNVSKICLGTMTFGEQNNEKQSFELLDYALVNGVNFFDTAETYSVPMKKETQGNCEKIIGNWLEKRKNRAKTIIATKIAGPGSENWIGHIRDGKTIYDSKTIKQALEGSLKRLKTDYIDLYQIHWPSRRTTSFGELTYPYDENLNKNFNQESDAIAQIVKAMNECIKEGKIRHYGLSNESPWGMMQYVYFAKTNHLKAPITIQNIYNLVNRSYEIAHSEVSQRENIDLLVYSPLAFSILSGKYLTDTDAPNSRINLYPNYFARFNQFKTNPILAQYLKLAQKHNLSLTQLALSFVQTKGFVGSNIIGATNLNQLKENIESININLDEFILNEIDAIHYSHPNPCL